MYDQLYSFLDNEEIITNQHSGFRLLHSTVTALLEATAVVFLDLKKAFDTVDHDVLLGKLSQYRIQKSAYDWFKSYLNNCTQKCEVNVRFPKSVLSAVGSLRELSLVLFSSSISDLYQ